MIVAIGPNVILAYCYQGLYHPARKVREAYWKIYNLLYIYASDALVMGYPLHQEQLKKDNEEEENCYLRSTMELFI